MENEVFFKRLRNLPAYKSKQYMEWVKAKHPDKERHHLLGSMTSIKLNDYLLLPVTHAEHERAERNKIDFAIDNLPQSLNLLFEYTAKLEQDINKLRELAESDMASIQELSETIDTLRQAYIENDKKWQADYDNLLVKYELTVERILEK